MTSSEAYLAIFSTQRLLAWTKKWWRKNGLVNSRSPKDLPAFNAKMVEEIAEVVHHE